MPRTQHHCRGCGNIYCSAHAPSTLIPPSNTRSLKLCWSCVLEGAIPLPAATMDDVSATRTSVSLSPTTARGLANALSPTVDIIAASGAAGGAYVAPQPPSPTYRHDDDDERQKSEPGFLSALVSLIEVVAAPPVRSRTNNGNHNNNNSQKAVAWTGGGGGGTSQQRQRERSPSPCRLKKMGGTPARPAVVSPTRLRQNGGGAALPPSRSPVPSTSVSRAATHRGRADEPPDGGGGVARRGGWREASPQRSSRAVPYQQHDSGLRVSIVGPPPKEAEQRGFGSSVSTASSTEAGDEYEWHRGVVAGSRVGGSSGGTVFTSSEASKPVELGFQREQPAELLFPSERPWGHGFGAP